MESRDRRGCDERRDDCGDMVWDEDCEELRFTYLLIQNG